MSRAVIQLEPLTCPSCIKKIESSVSKMAGVEQAKVLFNSSKVKADFDEHLTSAEAIRATIENLGYGIEHVKVS